MAALLALGAAATWGVADFLGGLTSRRANELSVAALSQVAGLLLLAIVLPLSGVAASSSALWWGAAAGLGGAGGLVAYFRALSIGPMGVTAPVAALTGAIVPVVAGVALGERPGAIAWFGIVVGLGATVLASRPAPADEVARDGEQAIHDHEPEVLVAGVSTVPVPAPQAWDGHEHATHHASTDDHALRTGLVAAAIAGLLFGLFFVALDQAPNDAGMWPLLGARASGLTMLALLLARRRPGVPERRTVGVAMASGLLDMTANALFLLAVQRGLLVLVSVLTSLYPVGVVLLARAVLGERLGRGQQIGVVLALVAVALIAL